MPAPAAPPLPVHILARPAQQDAVLHTVAHILEAHPLDGVPVTVRLGGGWSRRLREALAPWAPTVRLIENASLRSRVPAPPCLLLRPGVIPDLPGLAAVMASERGTARPLRLPVHPLSRSPKAPDGDRPALFGCRLDPAPAPSRPETDGNAPTGGVLVPSATPPAGVAALLNESGAQWDDLDVGPSGVLRGHVAPPGRAGSPDGLAALAGRHTGQSAVLLGNGASRPHTDAIADPGTVVFAFNGAWRLGPADAPPPDWLMIEDRLVAEDEAAHLNDAAARGRLPPLVLPLDHADILPPGPGRLHVAVDWSYYRADRPPCLPEFATLPTARLHAGQTVVYLALQVAFVMGCDPVILCGMDLDYRLPPPHHARIEGHRVTATGPDPNHFDPAYFGPGRRWHLPKTDRMLAALRHAARIYADHGRCLLNATPGGRLTGLPRTDYPAPAGPC